MGPSYFYIFVWIAITSRVVNCIRSLPNFALPGNLFDRGGHDVDPDLEKYYIPKEIVTSSKEEKTSSLSISKKDAATPTSRSKLSIVDREERNSRPAWLKRLPKVHLRCDPLVNFKLKQHLTLLGASITLGLDYLTDISQWRSYCQIEDAWLRGRFSLRGSELGWAKSWIIGLGFGEQSSAMIKLRLGLNMKTQRLYAKLRFRTDPMSPFDIGDGLSCAGKLPLPLHMLPSFSRALPLRVEYRVRINTSRGPQQSYYGRGSGSGGNSNQGRGSSPYKVVTMSTGVGAVEVSLDELNFCLEWDEQSPVWGIGLVRNVPNRKRVLPAFSTASSGNRDKRNSDGTGVSNSGSNNGASTGGGNSGGPQRSKPMDTNTTGRTKRSDDVNNANSNNSPGSNYRRSAGSPPLAATNGNRDPRVKTGFRPT